VQFFRNALQLSVSCKHRRLSNANALCSGAEQVTCGWCTWHCHEATAERVGQPSDYWRLPAMGQSTVIRLLSIDTTDRERQLGDLGDVRAAAGASA
jgi:hypothetical protein